MGKAILCVAVAAAMFVGVAIPKVYAENYSPSEEVVDKTVKVGDVLEFPAWGNQGMRIRYMDGSNELLSVNTKKGEGYTIPDYNSLGIYSLLPVGAKVSGWEITGQPTQDSSVLQWDLARDLEEIGDSGIYHIGSYALTKNTVYTLKGDLTHVEGDTTTYAKEIKFTVNADTQYTFK